MQFGTSPGLYLMLPFRRNEHLLWSALAGWVQFEVGPTRVCTAYKMLQLRVLWDCTSVPDGSDHLLWYRMVEFSSKKGPPGYVQNSGVRCNSELPQLCT
jgi:hypothetical protein